MHLLDLWEGLHREENSSLSLLGLLRQIGRLDAASDLEKLIGPWV